MSKARAKLVAPAADRLVADYHPTLEQQRFDVAQAELKSEVPTHGMADDRRRESVAVIERFRFSHRFIVRQLTANVTVPFKHLASRLQRSSRARPAQVLFLW
ncbi:hypothetical protein MB84_27670 (plasmid) [Pandoraea oxalativorans]|uniref:Uncharacterized protein n=1 Tax=Pandoraea oxalativorans TaxID=573737 RepID=A0A0G3IDE8_9BURK|nr:hypothetical protein MB84_27670 [Pandoraea oxalativorans]